MARGLTFFAAIVSLIVGIAVGIWATGTAVTAQSRMSRFYTEREGELLFIRYPHGAAGGMDCYLAVTNTGIIPVPCSQADMRSSRD